MSGAESKKLDASVAEIPSLQLSLDQIVSEQAPRPSALRRLGRYRIVGEIASGGMASVNMAVADGLEKVVALKVIHPHLAHEDSFIAMFLDEARIASSISHRNVCSVFDFGECEGHFFIAMEYLAGQCLRQVIGRQRTRLAEVDPMRLAAHAAYVIAEASEGLHAAHELLGPDQGPLNVVHRDVSPHNLFITFDGNVSVVDFGIASAENRLQHTATGIVKGKFSYMAPEQVRQAHVDRRADIWSLGVCLWETLTLRRLFLRETQADTLISLLTDPIAPPSEVVPALPRELDAIVTRALARDPAQRYATARELGRDLMAFCRESGVPVGPLELEQWMAQLFAQEITQKKRMVANALKAGPSSLWPDLTPSHAPHGPTHSGTMRKGWMNGAPSPTDVIPSPAPTAMDFRHGAQRGAQLAAVLAGGAMIVGLALMLNRGGLVESSYVEPPKTLALAPASVEKSPTPAPVIAVSAPPELPKPDVTPAPIKKANTQPASAMVRANRARVRTEPAATGNQEHALVRELDKVGLGPEPHQEEPASVASASPVEAPPPPEPAAVAPPSPAPPEPPTPAPSTRPLGAQVSLGEIKVNGSLGSGPVMRMFTRASPHLRACYLEAAKRAGHNDFSALTIDLLIDESGAPRDVRASNHPLSSLPACAVSTFRRLRSDIKPDVGTAQTRFVVQLKPL